MSKTTLVPMMRPIYDVMYDAKLIDKRMFSLCLGKDGGSF